MDQLQQDSEILLSGSLENMLSLHLIDFPNLLRPTCVVINVLGLTEQITNWCLCADLLRPGETDQQENADGKEEDKKEVELHAAVETSSGEEEMVTTRLLSEGFCLQ